MIQKNDWTDIVRSSLRDVEATPPANGWERLERSLKQTPPVRRRLSYYLPRVAAAAAAVLISFFAGDILLQEGHDVDIEGVTLSSTDGSKHSALDIINQESPAENPELTARVAQVLRSVQFEGGRTTAQAVSQGTREAATLPEPEVIPSTTAVVTQAAIPTSQPDQPNQQIQTQQRQPAAATTATTATTASAEKTEKAAPGQSSAARYWWDTPEKETPRARKQRRKASLGAFAGGTFASDGGSGILPGRLFSHMSSSDAPSIGDGFVGSAQRFDYTESSFRHKQPISFGVTVRKEFAHRLSLESGLVYSLLMSDVTLTHAAEDISQKLHFIGVPLRLNWAFYERGPFSLYIGAGGMAEKCVGAKFGSQTMKESKVQWSVQGIAGAQYKFGSLVGLYFEPEVSHYFTQTNMETARTDSPLTFTLRLGVRFSF